MDLLGDQFGLDAFALLVGHGALADLLDLLLTLLVENPDAAAAFPGGVEGGLREERLGAVRGHAEAPAPDFILSVVILFSLAGNDPGLGVQAILHRVHRAFLPCFGAEGTAAARAVFARSLALSRRPGRLAHAGHRPGFFPGLVHGQSSSWSLQNSSGA